MDKILNLNTKVAFFVYVFIDVICIGIGMGVPILSIMLGFPVGWYITRRVIQQTKFSQATLKQILKNSVLTSGVTFIIMIVIWGGTISWLFNPDADFQNFGHPFILYDPKISFIGWLILMVFISPFLQLLSTVFASFLTLIRWRSR